MSSRSNTDRLSMQSLHDFKDLLAGSQSQ